MKTDIDRYYNWYGTVDVFLDEASTDSTDITLYRDYYTYIKNRGGRVMLNPGTVPDQGYMTVSDQIMIFEDNYSAYASASFPVWISAYPASRFVHLVYQTPQNSLSTAISLAKQRNAGFIYITDDVLDNPWDTLLPYWQTEVNLKCQGTVPTATPGRKTGDANGDGKVDGMDYVVWLNNYGR